MVDIKEVRNLYPVPGSEQDKPKAANPDSSYNEKMKEKKASYLLNAKPVT